MRSALCEVEALKHPIPLCEQKHLPPQASTASFVYIKKHNVSKNMNLYKVHINSLASTTLYQHQHYLA